MEVSSGDKQAGSSLSDQLPSQFIGQQPAISTTALHQSER